MTKTNQQLNDTQSNHNGFDLVRVHCYSLLKQNVKKAL